MEFYPPGMPDDCFIRGNVPMTKSEVRAFTMSKARLKPGMRVLDIGAGTGSLTVEAALLCPEGEIYAVDCDPEALVLLERNIAHFGLTNVKVITGEAPEIIAGIPKCDRIFLGGSGGRMDDILAALPDCLLPGGIVVTNTITLETTNDTMQCFRQPLWKWWDIVQVSVARGVPAGSNLVRFEALNPVWVASAQMEG